MAQQLNLSTMKYRNQNGIWVGIPAFVGQGGGLSSGWVKRVHYIWDANKEYQPLTLDFATGEMTFAEAPPTNKCVWPTPNFDKTLNANSQNIYAMIPNEIMNTSYVSNFAQGTNGYTMGGVTSIAEGGANANVNVNAFHFEHSATAPSFTGLNSKHVKVRLTAPGGNIMQSNYFFSWYPKLSNGVTIPQTYATMYAGATKRMMACTVEQDWTVLDGCVTNNYTVSSMQYKSRTNGTQNWDAYSMAGQNIFYITDEDVTITGINFTSGNGNYFPSNGTLVEVFEYVD